MSNQKTLTVFICRGKDCRRAWRNLPEEVGVRRWVKESAAELLGGSRNQIETIETDCMDRCAEAGCLFVAGAGGAGFVTNLHGRQATQRLQQSLKVAIAPQIRHSAF
jgi:hypothetical protein